MLVINNLSVSINYNDDEIYKKLLKKYNFKNDLIKFEIIKRSIDARNEVKYILKLKVSLKNEDYYMSKYNLTKFKEFKLDLKKCNKNVLIVGYGPAGMFSSLLLQMSGCNCLVIERGMDSYTRLEDIKNYMENGVFNLKSNILFGEGGAGMFSDGKLTTGIKSDWIEFVFKTFVECGANKDILIDQYPHIGSDVLVEVCKNIREKYQKLGGKILFNHKLVDIIDDVAIIDGDLKEYKFDNLVLAIGHSARDTFYALEKRLKMEPKQFSMGVRIEHPQSLINNVQYKGVKGLPAANYKLSCKVNGRGCYTFCMCPGGVVVPSNSEEGMICTNGMSYYKRDLENANSAILVDVYQSDYNSTLFGGIELQRKYEKLAFSISNSYNAPVQKLIDFLNDRKTTSIGSVKPSYKPGYTLANLRDCLPEFIYDTIKLAIPIFDKSLNGFNYDDAILTGIEARSSSPVRILRDEFYRSSNKLVYPIGEGCGYAGGIVSAAVDGLKVALKIIEEEN